MVRLSVMIIDSWQMDVFFMVIARTFTSLQLTFKPLQSNMGVIDITFITKVVINYYPLSINLYEFAILIQFIDML